MKRKRLALLLGLLLGVLLILAACQGDAPETNDAESVNTETVVEAGTGDNDAASTEITGTEADVTEAAPEADAGMEPAQGGTLRIAMGTEPLAFDPPNYLATTDLIVTNLIFNGLVRFDLELNVVPALATEWEQLDDTTWRFTLREEVLFSDGSTFDAEDVKASFERGILMPRGQAFIGFIESVDIVEDYVVDINTTNPFGPFLQHMATPVAAITSADHLEAMSDEELQLNPIGTGPYKLEEFIPQRSTTLVRNENYWGDEPYYLDRIVINVIPEEATRYAALRAGDVDIIENPPPTEAETIRNSGDLQLITSPATRDVRLSFQMQEETLSDPLLRQAIMYAIDSEALVEFVVEGLGRPVDNGWLPPEVFTPDPPVSVPYDPERARELLAEAGYADGLTLGLRTPEGRYLRDREIAEAIQGQLSEVGINVELLTVEWGAYLDSLSNHEGQLFIIGWGISTGDPAVVARQNLHSENAFNYAGYNSERVDEIIAQAEQTTDPAVRQALYQEMTEIILTQDYLMKPIYWKLNLFAANSRVHDFQPTPLEQIDVSNTWIEVP